MDRETCLSFDQQDPLSSVRNHFAIPDGIVYLDGNSLGALPAEIPSRIEQVVRQEWGSGLIRSWNDAGWMDAPGRVGEAACGSKASGIPGFTFATSRPMSL